MGRFGSDEISAKIFEGLDVGNNKQLDYFKLRNLYGTSQVEVADLFVKRTLSSDPAHHELAFLYLLNKQSLPDFKGFDNDQKKIRDSLPLAARVVIEKYPQFKTGSILVDIDASIHDDLATAEPNKVWFPLASALLSSMNAERARIENNPLLAQKALDQIDSVERRGALSAFPLLLKEVRLSALFAAGQDDRLARLIPDYVNTIAQGIRTYEKPEQVLSELTYKRYSLGLTKMLALLRDYHDQTPSEITAKALEELQKSLNQLNSHKILANEP